MIAGLLLQPTADTQKRQQGGIWDYISPSRLNLWLKCPLAWKLRYVDRIRTPPNPALFLGKMAHLGLEVYYRHRQFGVTLTTKDVVQQLHESWEPMVVDEGMKFKDSAAEAALKEQGARLVTAYIEQVPAGEPRPIAVETAVEAPLVDPANGEDLGIPLVGIIDLVLPGEGGAAIIDFKTAARGGRLLEITHEIQLTCYAHAYRQAAGETEGELQIRRLVKTKTPQIETHPFPPRTDAHFGRLFVVIREYLNALERASFTYRPGHSCSFCDFAQSHCSAWSP